MCFGGGASSTQTELQQSQLDFTNQLMSEYNTAFGQNQAILGQLTKSFEPTLAAGPNQEGFSQGEVNNLNSQAATGVGQNYNNASEALSVQQGAEGNGETFIPTGAKQQQQEQLATGASQQLSGEQSQILQSDYATGQQNYLNAANALGGVAGQLNPNAYAGAATGAGSAASQTANEVTQANNANGQAWAGLIGGTIGAAGTAAGNYFANSGPSTPAPSPSTVPLFGGS